MTHSFLLIFEAKEAGAIRCLPFFYDKLPHMNPWIPHPIRLDGDTVTLRPLEETHLNTLEAIAQDGRIWEFYPTRLDTREKFRTAFRTAFTERSRGTQYPFVIFHRREKRLIGSTRFLDLRPEHRKLEIGWTWLDPAYWGSGVNLECKLLLLTECFEKLGTIRVQLKTDETNIRSRKAIEKIGGKFEGILRNDMIRDNGTFRNSAYFSILTEEWDQAKKLLLHRRRDY